MAVFGLFAGLAGRFLAGPLGHPSPALTGLAIILTFAAGVTVQSRVGSLTIAVALSVPEERDGTVATFFVAGYAGISQPCLGAQVAGDRPRTAASSPRPRTPSLG